MVAENLRAPWWKWLLFSLGLIIMEVLFVMAGILVVLFQGVDFQLYMEVSRPPFITDSVVGAGFALMLAGQNLAPLVLLPCFRPTRRIAFADFRRPNAGALSRLLVGAALAFILQVVWTHIGPLPAEKYRLVEHIAYAVAGGGQFWPKAWLLLAVAFVVPVCEEVLFRGLAFGFARRRWGFWIGAALSAAIFGLAHGLAGALPAGLLGFYLAYQVEHDGSLFGAMTLHGLNNLAAVLLMYLQAAPFR